MFVRRKMYRELGGYQGVRKTPLRELQEVRLSIVAEFNVGGEEAAELKRKQAEMERKAQADRAKLEKRFG